MAVFYNLKGTTQPFFQIGKQGATLYPGSDDPTIAHTVVDGDLWFPPNRQLKIRASGEWETILFDNIEISDGRITHISNATEQLEIKTDYGLRLIDINDDIIADFYDGSGFGTDGWLTFQAALGGNAFIGVTSETPGSSNVGIRFYVLGTGTLSVDDGVAYSGNISDDGDIVVKRYVDDTVDAIFDGLDNNGVLYLDNTGSLSTTTSFMYDGTALSIDNIEISGNTISSTNINGDIILLPDGTGDVLIGNDQSTETIITAPDEQDLFIEAGLASGAAHGGDLYLRGGDATGTGDDGDVIIDRGRLLVDGVQIQGWSNIVTATSITATPWDRVFVTAATQTITLPATPSDGTEVIVSVVGTFTDTIIARNGQSIMGVAEDMAIDQPNITVHLVYVNSTLGWRVI